MSQQLRGTGARMVTFYRRGNGGSESISNYRTHWEQIWTFLEEVRAIPLSPGFPVVHDWPVVALGAQPACRAWGILPQQRGL